MERAFWLLDRGTSFNGVQVVTLRGPIDDQRLKVALKRQQQRDALLRGRGVRGLRVADASVIPSVPVSAMNAPSMVIGYRAAQLVKQAQQSSEEEAA